MQLSRSLVFSRIALVSIVLVSLPLAGCTVTVADPNPPADGNNDADDNRQPPPPSNIIKVRFINETDVAVDVQFYASATPVDANDIDNTLFVPGNLRTLSIGFAGLGVIPPGEVDEITLDCSNASAIGTKGGLFTDVETGELLGAGRQRFLLIDNQYGCNDTITIFYKPDGDTYNTTFLVQ
jgi:hypothetical protein